MKKSKIEKEIIELRMKQLESDYQETLKWINERISSVKECIKLAESQIEKSKLRLISCISYEKEEVFHFIQKSESELKCSKDQLGILKEIKGEYKRK